MKPSQQPSLVVREHEPFNAETPLSVLGAPLTPAESFYVRNHLPVPDLQADAWRLGVNGAVEQPRTFSLEQIKQFPARTIRVTLECAGNGRARMSQVPKGTPWEYGAAGTADFSGTPLRTLLEQVTVRPDAVEVLFAGADRGPIAPGREGAYERSLSIPDALAPDVLLAWSMNGRPLAPEHGFPLRLVVPGWYGMASVKWLARVTAVTAPFTGYYQTERYIYVAEPGTADGTPVRLVRVRSVIASPSEGSVLSPGRVEITGSAWSGAAPIARVDLSFDGGRSWAPAEVGESRAGAAAMWRTAWSPPRPGDYTILSRATDAAGNVQPVEPAWNLYGYGNNAVQRVRVVVGPAG